MEKEKMNSVQDTGNACERKINNLKTLLHSSLLLKHIEKMYNIHKCFLVGWYKYFKDNVYW